VLEIMNIITTFGATGEEPQGIAALGIDPLAILAQASTFLVLFFIIKKFALDKIVTTLEQRRKTIDDGVRLGREMEAEKERLSEEIGKELHKARIEADKIIATSREEAAGILRDAQEAAQRKTDALLADARAKIEEDILAARQNLEKDILELVAEATAIIAEEKLDAKKDMNMIERAIAKVRSA
jgi:F-type H+-transporting ATPase subunit b